MLVILDGIVTNDRSDFPPPVSNIFCPIIVNPSLNISWDKREQPRNAEIPIERYNSI